MYEETAKAADVSRLMVRNDDDRVMPGIERALADLYKTTAEANELVEMLADRLRPALRQTTTGTASGVDAVPTDASVSPVEENVRSTIRALRNVCDRLSDLHARVDL